MGGTNMAKEAVPAAREPDWLLACRSATTRIQSMLAEQSREARRAYTGTRGSGGDQTLMIDAAAEAIVFDELDALHAAGHRFHAVSEERGEVDFGSSEVRIVIDPIDGSLNAKRGGPHYALSIAVASGMTMDAVDFGYVHEFGTNEEWWARAGAGAFLNGEPLDPGVGEVRGRDGRLEVLGIESADPRWVRASIDALALRAYRLRAYGALASALCQVAAGRFDALVSLRRCRAVDVAAAQLIVREAGGVVSFPSCPAPLAAPLDTAPHSSVVAARTMTTLNELEAIVA